MDNWMRCVAFRVAQAGIDPGTGQGAAPEFSEIRLCSRVAKGKLVKTVDLHRSPIIVGYVFGFPRFGWEHVPETRLFTGKTYENGGFGLDFFLSNRSIDGKPVAGHPYGGWHHADQRSWQPRTFRSMAGWTTKQVVKGQILEIYDLWKRKCGCVGQLNVPQFMAFVGRKNWKIIVIQYGFGGFPSALVIDSPSIPWVDTIWRTVRPCAGYSVLEYTGADVMCIDYIEGEEGERQRGREREIWPVRAEWEWRTLNDGIFAEGAQRFLHHHAWCHPGHGQDVAEQKRAAVLCPRHLNFWPNSRAKVKLPPCYHRHSVYFNLKPSKSNKNHGPLGSFHHGLPPNHPKLDNFSAETCWNQWWLWDPSFSETRRNPEMFRMFPPCEVEMARTRVPCRPSTVPWIPGRHSWVPNNVQPWIHTLW